MGYGFVDFESKLSADKALKTMQHKELEGHALELKISTRDTQYEIPSPPTMLKNNLFFFRSLKLGHDELQLHQANARCRTVQLKHPPRSVFETFPLLRRSTK